MVDGEFICLLWSLEALRRSAEMNAMHGGRIGGVVSLIRRCHLTYARMYGSDSWPANGRSVRV